MPVSPAACAALFRDGQVDISLCPVGALELMPPHQLCTDYCIRADGDVDTVVLLSQVPPDQISRVRLDNNSRTSNKLVQILASLHWKKTWEFYFDNEEDRAEACVMIGDRVFEKKSEYPFHIDLAGEWKKMTGLPMVFAVWITRPGVLPEIEVILNDAFRKGIDRIPTSSLQVWQKNYLLHNISYSFDNRKKVAMNLFLQYAK